MAKKKYTLPTNRFEAFKDIFFNQFRLILKLGFLTFLILLPIIIIYILTNIKIYEVNLSAQENLISSNEQFELITGYTNARNLLFIILLPFSFYFLSGIFNIIRKVVWQEGVLFFLDYKKGLKNNGLYFIIISLILSIIHFIFSYTLRMELVNHTIPNLLALCFSFVALIILIMFLPFLLHQTIIYNLKFTHKIKNTLIIFSKLFYIFLILLVLNLIPILLLFINNGILMIIFIITH